MYYLLIGANTYKCVVICQIYSPSQTLYPLITICDVLTAQALLFDSLIKEIFPIQHKLQICPPFCKQSIVIKEVGNRKWIFPTWFASYNLQWWIPILSPIQTWHTAPGE